MSDQTLSDAPVHRGELGAFSFRTRAALSETSDE
jgi:hypothetical protein